MTPTLYKYVSPEGVDLLLNQRIKATPPNRFNDAFEFQPLVEGKPSRTMVKRQFNDKGDLRVNYNVDVLAGRTRESFKAYKARIRGLRKGSAPEIADRVARYFDAQRHTMVNRLSDLIGVICFTEVPTSLLMWAHYASSHTGMVIGFDVQHPAFVKTPRLEPVKYSHARPVLKIGGKSSTSLFQAGWEALLTKSMEWAYEAEWRTTVPLKSTQQVLRNGLTEHFAALPIQAVKSVILGARSSPDLQRKVLQIVAHPDRNHIEVAKARLHDKEYRLEITEMRQPPG